MPPLAQDSPKSAHTARLRRAVGAVPTRRRAYRAKYATRVRTQAGAVPTVRPCAQRPDGLAARDSAPLPLSGRCDLTSREVLVRPEHDMLPPRAVAQAGRAAVRAAARPTAGRPPHSPAQRDGPTRDAPDTQDKPFRIRWRVSPGILSNVFAICMLRRDRSVPASLRVTARGGWIGRGEGVSRAQLAA